jgi:Tol biopolymer transport system component
LARSGGFHKPRISPDRQKVAFRVENKSRLIDLYVIPVAGGVARKILDGEWLATMDPAEFELPVRTVVDRFGWLPDSSGLAFGTWEDDRSEGVYMGRRREHDDLWRLGLDGDEPTRLLARGLGGAFAFSSDGKHVALTKLLGPDRNHRVSVAVANADGSERRELFDHTYLSSETDGHAISLAQWTADNRALLVVDPIPMPEYDNLAYFDSASRLLELALDGSTTYVADAARGSIAHSWTYNAAWSPDGSRVAYLEALPTALPAKSDPELGYPAPPTRVAPTSRARLVIAERDGSRRLALVEVSAVEGMQFEWSPDGRRLAFWEPPYQGRDQERIWPPVQIFGIDGSVLRTPPVRPLHIWWLSPDRLLVRHDDKMSLFPMDAASDEESGSSHSEPTDLQPISVMQGLDWISLDLMPSVRP